MLEWIEWIRYEQKDIIYQVLVDMARMVETRASTASTGVTAFSSDTVISHQLQLVISARVLGISAGHVTLCINSSMHHIKYL